MMIKDYILLKIMQNRGARISKYKMINLDDCANGNKTEHKNCLLNNENDLIFQNDFIYQNDLLFQIIHREYQ